MVLELWGWGNGNSSKPNPRISGRRGLHDKPHHAESIWGSTKTEVGGISAGLILVAAFSGNPAAGAAPLMVQFTDLPT
jgi:PKD repeat protein